MSKTLPSSFRTTMSRPSNLFPVSITDVASNLISFISSAGRFPDRICDRNETSSRILWHIGWKLSWLDCGEVKNEAVQGTFFYHEKLIKLTK